MAEQKSGISGATGPEPLDPARPFEPTGMTTAAWMALPVTEIVLRTLTFCQASVSVVGLLAPQPSPWCADPFIHVVAYAGQSYLDDGHHRVVRALLQGQATLPGRILDLPVRTAPTREHAVVPPIHLVDAFEATEPVEAPEDRPAVGDGGDQEVGDEDPGPRGEGGGHVHAHDYSR